MNPAFVIFRGIVYAIGFVFLWAWIATFVMQYDTAIPFTIPAWLVPVGFVIAVCGAALTAWCIFAFITLGQGTPAPFDPPREFISSGAYRYTRNPMYVGALSVILGAGIAAASPSITLLAIFFAGCAHLFVVIYEEPALERQFGDSYRRYKASTNRWLPAQPGRRA